MKNDPQKDIHIEKAEKHWGCELYTKLCTLFTFWNVEKEEDFWGNFEQMFCEEVIKKNYFEKRLEFVEERKRENNY